ncbi:MAG TPA: hypothetical protein VGL06_26260 [Pseudonocardiaceae bacterium]
MVKERLVRQPSYLRPTQLVDLIAPADQLQGLVQGARDLGKHHGRGRQGPFRLLKLLRDARLLLPADIFRNGTRHNTPTQPPPLLLQLGDPTAGVGHLRLRPPLLLVQLDAQALPDRLLETSRDTDRGVVALNGPLNVLSREIRQLTVGPPLVSTETKEVQVLPLGVGDAQPRATAPAEDTRLQVVTVDALALAGLVVQPKDLLDAIE